MGKTLLELVNFGAEKHFERMKFVTMASFEEVAIPGKYILVGFMVLSML